MVHELNRSFGLLQNVVEPDLELGTNAALERYHSPDYLDSLANGDGLEHVNSPTTSTDDRTARILTHFLLMSVSSLHPPRPPVVFCYKEPTSPSIGMVVDTMQGDPKRVASATLPTLSSASCFLPSRASAMDVAHASCTSI